MIIQQISQQYLKQLSDKVRSYFLLERIRILEQKTALKNCPATADDYEYI
ncbi:MAG: hypothetical protein ACPG5B_12260 [Chitinophagales bacterium]